MINLHIQYIIFYGTGFDKKLKAYKHHLLNRGDDNDLCISNPNIINRMKIWHAFSFLEAFLKLAAVLDYILNTGVMPGLPKWQTLVLKTTDQDE